MNVVDIKGELEGERVNGKDVEEILKEKKKKVKIGGGIRKIENIEKWI